MRIKNDSLTFDTTDLAQATCTSVAVNLSHISQFAVQLVTSGTHAGTFKVQVSCDAGSPNAGTEAQQATGVSNWSDLPNATAAVTNGAAYLIHCVDAGYNWARIVYTKTSGTGSITSARINTKGV